MATEHLKRGKSAAERSAEDEGVRGTVEAALDEIEARGDDAVREPAFELALQTRGELPVRLLRDGLADPVASIRRRASTAMGNRGDDKAKDLLIGELAHNPSVDVIEALAAIRDDDVIVHLGRCAKGHPALERVVIEALRNMESPKAQRLAAHIKADTSR